jgi:hypothetical protein
MDAAKLAHMVLLPMCNKSEILEGARDGVRRPSVIEMSVSARSPEPNAPVRRPLLARTSRSGTSAILPLSGGKRTLSKPRSTTPIYSYAP